MRVKGVPVLVCALAVSLPAFAQNSIEEWTGIGSGYTIHPTLHRIEITASGTYGFQALDGGVPGAGYIDQIQIDPGVTGTVTLMIKKDPALGDGPGATNVNVIDLRGNGSGTVGDFWISGDVGAGGVIYADALGGSGGTNPPFRVGGDILSNMQIEYLHADLTCGMMQNLVATGTATHRGSITIADLANYGGAIFVGGKLDGAIDIWRASGSVTVAEMGPSADVFIKHLDGTFQCTGTTWTGSSAEFGQLNGTANFLAQTAGGIVVGDLWGNLSIEDLQDYGPVWGDGGYVRVLGSLGSLAHVHIDSKYSGAEYLTVDYDGYDSADTWQSGGIVRVGDENLTGNSPGYRVYEVTCVKGDMNNDNVVNAGDIDPFVAVINANGCTPAAGLYYDQTYPGLCGSAEYHADMNCDGLVNAGDLDPFTLKLTDPAQYAIDYPGCEECPGSTSGMSGLSGFGNTAADVALLYGDHTAAERLTTLEALVQDLITQLGNAPRAQFWSDVLTILQN